jgi:hypothetical protein
MNGGFKSASHREMLDPHYVPFENGLSFGIIGRCVMEGTIRQRTLY